MIDEVNAQPKTVESQRQGLLSMFRGGVLYSSAVVLGKALLFMHSILLSQMLPINDLGVYYLGQTSVLMLAGFLVMGLDVGIIRFVAISTNKDRLTLPSTLVTGSTLVSLCTTVLVITVMFYFLKDISFIFLKHGGFESIFLFFLLSVPFVVTMRMFLSATRGLKIVSYTALVEQVIMGVSLFLLSAAVLFFSRAGLLGLAVAYLASNAIAFTASYLYARRHFSMTLSGCSWDVFRPVIVFSAPLVVSQWLFFLINYLSTFMLAFWGLSRDVALYNTALRVMVVAEVVANSVVVVFNPIVAELVAQERFEELRSSYRNASRWIFMICCPFFVLTLCFHENFLAIFGKEFLAAGTCLMIICGSALFEYSMPMLGSLIAMSGHTKLTLFNNLASLCALIGTSFILIPRLGVNGVAIAWAISSILLTCLRLVENKFLFKLRPLQKSHIKIAAASLVSAGILKLVVPFFEALPSGVVLSILLITGMALYGFFILIFGMDDDDIFMISKMKEKILGGTVR